MSDMRDWFNNIPRFTRYWLTSTIVVTLAARFGLVRPQNLILLYEPLKNFEIWRLLTCVFYYPLNSSNGFHFLINMYFLYTYSTRLELGRFAGKPSDYVFMLLFNWLCCIMVGLAVDIYLLMDPMVLSVLYIWCQLNKEVTVNFWFGSRFKAMYLPWVLLAFNIIISGGGIYEIVGILVGHFYYFLAHQYPQDLGGPLLIHTPSILKEWFPDLSGGARGFGHVPDRTPGEPQAPINRGGVFRGGHNWGRGNVLGGN